MTEGCDDNVLAADCANWHGPFSHAFPLRISYSKSLNIIRHGLVFSTVYISFGLLLFKPINLSSTLARNLFLLLLQVEYFNLIFVKSIILLAYKI